MLTFIDVSVSQRGIDLANAGLDGCAVKASGANDGLYVAGAYASNLQEARDTYGTAIHYFFNGQAATPTEAANYFVDNADLRPGEGIALDVEDEKNSSGVIVAKAYSPDEAYEYALRAKQRTGLAPLIYASASVLRSQDWSKCIALGCCAWPAAWGSNNGQPAATWPDLGPQWPVDQIVMWQYTSNGQITGWAGRVDLNQSKKKVQELHSMALADYDLIGPIQTVIAADDRDWYVSWQHHLERTGGLRGGIDLVAAVGTPVVAPTPGIMAHLPNDGSAGNSCRFYHDKNSGWKDVFSHLSNYTKPSGSWFAKGAIVAYSGNSGNVTQHLHRHLLDPQNIRRNPKDYFSSSTTAGGGTTPIPITPKIDEDMMIRIQSTNRGIALVGAGYYNPIANEEELQNSGPLYSAHYTGNDRQFDLWVKMAYGGKSSAADVSVQARDEATAAKAAAQVAAAEAKIAAKAAVQTLEAVGNIPGGGGGGTPAPTTFTITLEGKAEAAS